VRACLLLIVLVLVATAGRVAAQDVPARRYLPDTSDEDWSFLATAPHIDLWDPLKYIRLRDDDDDWFVTLSGEVRYRPEGFRVHPLNGQPSIVDNYLLQRYLAGADVHLGSHVRVFVELQSGIIDGSLRSPRPTDQDTLDLHQGFVEWRRVMPQQRRLTLTIGRQELSVGSTRLISASPGLNVKRAFDGVAVGYRAPTWTLAGAVAALVGISCCSFDDRSAIRQPFWGVAVGRKSPRFERGELGLYYLGIDRSLSAYHQGLGPERRHTIGIKWNGVGKRGDLNYDGLFQWGEFAHAPIRAWAFATETGYRPMLSGWRPRVSARVDVASGDRSASDAHLQTFNPLFPGNSYSGAVGLLGPGNLTDFTPAVTVVPRPTLTIGFEAPSYWRTSTGDGIYATDQRALIPPQAGTGRYVGTNPGIVAVWQATRHWQGQGAITRFHSGEFLKDTFVGAGFGFYSISAVYRF
jgi:hypothetical protein